MVDLSIYGPCRRDHGPYPHFIQPIEAGELPASEEHHLSTKITHIIEQHHVAGAAVGLVRGGKVVWNKGFGLSQPREGLSVTCETPFMLASVSKLVTTTAVQVFLKETGLSWDTPVADCIDFEISHPHGYGRQITLRQLATHCSSIRDQRLWKHPERSGSLYSRGDHPMSLGDVLKAYLTKEGRLYHPDNFLRGVPGTEYSYSNFGIDLLAYAVECLSGVPFHEYCKTKIFNPLGMDSCGWHLRDHDDRSVALPCEWNGQSFHSFGHYGYPDYPSGQLRASVDDMNRFLTGIFKETVLSRDAYREMFDYAYQNRVGRNKGLGWGWHHQKGFWLVGHGGSDFGVCTSVYYDPSTDTGITILLNGGGRSAKNSQKQIMDEILSFISHQPMDIDMIGMDDRDNLLSFA